jgi:competence protein ComEC
LPGDLEGRGEAELLASGKPIRAEVLIVAHHGSRTGSRAEFLDRAQPEWAVVSAGFANRFGHPHPEVLRRIAAAGVSLLRTDLDGALVLRASPTGWEVQRTRTTEGAWPRAPSAAQE